MRLDELVTKEAIDLYRLLECSGGLTRRRIYDEIISRLLGGDLEFSDMIDEHGEPYSALKYMMDMLSDKDPAYCRTLRDAIGNGCDDVDVDLDRVVSLDSYLERMFDEGNLPAIEYRAPKGL